MRLGVQFSSQRLELLFTLGVKENEDGGISLLFFSLPQRCTSMYLLLVPLLSFLYGGE